MEYLVVVEVEIDGNKIEHFTSVNLRQSFNEHHVFTIRVKHDVMENLGTFSLDNSKKLIGKTVLIRFFTVAETRQLSYEFKGIICEIGTSKSTNDNGDLLLKGYSPTILLEDGAGYSSFNEKNLKDIFSKASKNFEQSDCNVNVNPGTHSPIRYVARYKESNFHFLNRLSADYGELFYYDGMTLNFGPPATMEFVEVVSGVDISNLKLKMRVSPIEAWNFAYTSQSDEYITTRGPEIDGLDPYPQHAVDVSKSLFSELDDVPIYHPVDSTDHAEALVQKSKEAKAADLVVLTGTSILPDLKIGSVAVVQISRMEGNSFLREDLGSYLITSITHQFSQNGSYYNSFEALSGWVRGIPVKHIVNPMAEPQYAWVVDNKDPDKLGRVRVKMQWQSDDDDEKTDWISVMSPDAGGGKDGARGGGMMVLPEVNDLVLVGFIYNNPDRPFVMGSMFNGKSAPDGSIRALKGRRSSALVQIDDAIGSVLIGDGGDNTIYLNGDSQITIETTGEIKLKVGSSEIKIEPSKITIQADEIKINATNTVDVQGGSKAVIKKDDATYFKAEGTAVTMEGMAADVKGNTKATVGGTQVEINGTSMTKVKGGVVQINP